MFLSETHSPQVLDASSYVSEKYFNAEKRVLLEPAWHCVGCQSDVPQVGDFITLMILDRPVLVRRGEDSIRAFLNVCSHRFCTLTEKARGNAARMKCQYHGWEYDDAGQTKRIPDAPSFKPLKKGELGLHEFRCETRAGLIFVSLPDGGMPLSEFLGERGELIDQWFHDRWVPMMSYSESIPCNWKTYIENGLESYHIDTVHAATLVRRPDPEQCQHDFKERSTRFIGDQEAPDAVSRWLDQKTHQWLELEREPYQHVHVYPTLTFIRMAGFSYLEAIIPIAAESTMVVTRGFAYRGRRDRWYTAGLSCLSRRWGRRFLKQIQDEDVAILSLNQAGIRSPSRPQGGVISIREERIFHFQNYIANHMTAS